MCLVNHLCYRLVLLTRNEKVEVELVRLSQCRGFGLLHRVLRSGRAVPRGRRSRASHEIMLTFSPSSSINFGALLNLAE